MGHWKSTFHKLVRDLLKVNIVPYEAHGFSSVLFAKDTIRGVFLWTWLWKGFSCRCKMSPTLPFSIRMRLCLTFINQSRGSISSYGSDTARKVTCFGNSGLKISQVPHHVTSCKDVSRTSMFIPLLPCSLEGIPFQLWTVICYKGPEWNGLQECVPRDKKGICWAFVRL